MIHPPPDRTDRQLLRAHARDDRPRLAALYLRLGRTRLDAGDEDAAGFFLTQAYVFALDGGEDETARAAHAMLVDLGREMQG